MEEVYLRMHKSNQVDAIQYTPIFNDESNWQLFKEYQAQISFKNSGWNTLRMEIQGQSAEVFVNNEKVMTIDQLRTGQTKGAVGLFALFNNRFSNFRITHKNAPLDFQQTRNDAIAPNLITQWNITTARPYKEATLNPNDFSEEVYTKVETESSGLLPISKYVKKSISGNFEQNAEDYIIASTAIQADRAEIQLFSFDYSDKIIVYLNDKLVFKGNNAFRSKGIQYMGHLDINANTLYLPLEKGHNKIDCVVIDKANGWGLMAKLQESNQRAKAY